jgi:hypothetical protein
MSLNRKNRSFFWSSLLPKGSAYKRFKQGNYPDETTFRYLFESLLFSKDSDNSASLTDAGHAKTATDNEVAIRYNGYTDSFIRFVQPHQLPLDIATLRHISPCTLFTNSSPLDRTLTIPGSYFRTGNRIVITMLAGSSIYYSVSGINKVDFKLTLGSNQTFPFLFTKGSDLDPATEMHKYVMIIDLISTTQAYVKIVDDYDPNGINQDFSDSLCYNSFSYVEGTDGTLNIKTTIESNPPFINEFRMTSEEIKITRTLPIVITGN